MYRCRGVRARHAHGVPWGNAVAELSSASLAFGKAPEAAVRTEKQRAIGSGQGGVGALADGIGGDNFRLRSGPQDDHVAGLVRYVDLAVGKKHRGPGAASPSLASQALFPDLLSAFQLPALSDSLPADLSCSWTSLAADGATGNTDGSGDIGETLDMPAGSSVTYTLACDTGPAATGTIDNTATVTAPAGIYDPDGGNDSDTDSDTVVDDVVFKDGFETGDTREWSPAVI